MCYRSLSLLHLMYAVFLKAAVFTITVYSPNVSIMQYFVKISSDSFKSESYAFSFFFYIRPPNHACFDKACISTA